MAAAQDGSTPQAPRPEPLRLPPPGLPAAVERDNALSPVVPRSRGTRGVTVTGRNRPAYDPLGVLAGGFRIDAAANLQAGFDSNVYRAEEGTSDAFASAEANVGARSQWSRHSLSAEASVSQVLYASESVRDFTAYDLGLTGRYDLARATDLTVGLSQERSAIDQFSASEIAIVLQPVASDRTTATLRASTTMGRWFLSANGAFVKFNLEDSATLNGVEQSLRDRDYESYTAGAQIGYNTPSGARIFVSGTHEWRRHAVPSIPGRDVDTLELLAGVESEITPLLLGRLSAGYIQASFSDPSVDNRGALAIDTRLDYLITQLTTINLRARRTVRQLALVNSPGALATQFRLGADHELLRNLILSAGAFYEKADYFERDNDARVLGAEFATRWLINRRFQATASANYRTRDSDAFGPGANYDSLIATVGLTASL
ncbi:outer membrane beta-barrel protein [Croceibacterium sp. TMG7-5b_MA50]|uniref:outer membrane beta-barrel protein n=1 Tax=Croceibacterium sp. TMG7-5b_MA50 TaxID=3121290 RepID=UPI0032216DE6